MSEITAKLRKVIWRSMETDYTIAAFQPEDIGLEFIATGDLFNPAAGITYDMAGKWEDHPKYGKQFQIQSYSVQQPVDVDSIAIFLERHVKGIGPVIADVIIEKYGKDTIKILKGAPERVSDEIRGISYDLAKNISNQLNEGDKRQEIMMKLEGVFAKVKGLPRRLAGDLLATYGLTAFEVVKANPYILTGMARVGFILADKAAMAFGVRKDDPERIRAGIRYVIKQTMQATGDVWLARGSVVDGLMELISGVSADVVVEIIDRLVADEVLVRHKGFVTLTKCAKDEDIIAECVGRFLI